MFSLKNVASATAASLRAARPSGVRMISGARFPTLLHTQRKQEEYTGYRHGYRGCILKSMDGMNRGFSSQPFGSKSGQGKSWLMAIGSAALGVGGAVLAYTQTEEGKIWGDNAYTWVQDTLGMTPKGVPFNKMSLKDSPKVETKGIGTSKTTSSSKPKQETPQVSSCHEKEAHCAEDCNDCIERKCGDSDCLRKMDKEEEMIAKANQELEKALKDVKPKAIEYTESALKAYCEATELIQQFMDKVYCAIEEDNLESPRFEEVWCDVYDTALKRCEKVKEAIQKGKCAWELLCRLREVIENGKACKYTSCNPLLITAEEALMCAERELTNAKAKMECVQSESKLVEQYRNVVEDFRRDLKAELDSIATSADCKDTFTQNECTMVITHAYKKVIRIQKELAQVQVCTGQVPERLQSTLC